MKILAVDLGDARTGLATCDATELLASPVGVIHEKDPGTLLKKVAGEALRIGVGEIVVGHPKNMDNTLGERAEKSAQFARKLEEATGLPVVLWDERGTTVTAHGYLNVTNTRGKKRKAVVDAVAATIILENYLAYRKQRGAAER